MGSHATKSGGARGPCHSQDCCGRGNVQATDRRRQQTLAKHVRMIVTFSASHPMVHCHAVAFGLSAAVLLKLEPHLI